MTFSFLVRFVFEIIAVGACSYALYRQKDLIRFEKKVWKYTKAFVKACYCTLQDRFAVRNCAPIVPVRTEKYKTDIKLIGNTSNITDAQIAS